MVAAAQRIGPYEVLEPSSEEVEKVREGRGLGGSAKARFPREKDEAEAWGLRGRGGTEGLCPLFLPHEEGLRVRVLKNEITGFSSPSKKVRMRREGAGDRTKNHSGWDGEAALPSPVYPLRPVSLRTCVHSAPWT